MISLVLTSVFASGLAQRAEALDVGVSLNVGLGNYFDVPESQIVLMQNRGLPVSEIPVALYLARSAAVEPMTIVDLRLGGSSWNDIRYRHNLDPEVFYVPLDEPMGPYSSVYSHPVDTWGSLTLSNADYVNLANLRFMTDYYGYEPVEVVRLRARGDEFSTIATVLANILSLATHFNTPRNDLYGYYTRGLPIADFPVALYLSSQARVAPLTIVDYRLGGLSWYDIGHRYNLGPDIFYVPAQQVYGPYSTVYSQFRTRPKHLWRNLRLRDNDYVELANLRFATEHFRQRPEHIMKLRARHRNAAQLQRALLEERRASLLPKVRPWSARAKAETRRMFQTRREEARKADVREQRQAARQQEIRQERRAEARQEAARKADVRESRQAARQTVRQQEARQKEVRKSTRQVARQKEVRKSTRQVARHKEGRRAATRERAKASQKRSIRFEQRVKPRAVRSGQDKARMQAAPRGSGKAMRPAAQHKQGRQPKAGRGGKRG